MPSKSPEDIADVLRDRVLRAIRAGTLEPGARLPSARELAGEFNVDNRVTLAAYRLLAVDGLVEIRERGGVYVQRHFEGGTSPTLPVRWFADVFAEGLARGISSADLGECLRGLAETVRLRAIVISTTEDQVAGLARELREDFGLNAEGLAAAAVRGTMHHPALRRADVLIATAGHKDLAESLAREIGKPAITIDVRPDLIIGEWAMHLRQPVWAVVATAEFGEMLRRFFADVPGSENLNVVVHGRDDLTRIPLGARTYVTHRVRESLDTTPIRGKILPPARTISTDSAREIFDFIVRANYRAQQAIRAGGDAANRPA